MQKRNFKVPYVHRTNVLKNIAIGIIVLVAVNIGSTANAQNDFGYKDIPLSWRNFTKKSTNAKSVVAAATAIHISIESEVVEDELTIIIQLNQLKSQSWVSRQFLRKASDRESLNLLNHERLHYAINLIGIKSMYDEFMEATFTNDYKSEVAAIFQRHNQRTSKLNGDYDRLTRHGSIEEIQKDWEEDIFDRLNILYKEGEEIETRYIIEKKLQ